MTRSPVDPLVK